MAGTFPKVLSVRRRILDSPEAFIVIGILIYRARNGCIFLRWRRLLVDGELMSASPNGSTMEMVFALGAFYSDTPCFWRVLYRLIHINASSGMSQTETRYDY